METRTILILSSRNPNTTSRNRSITTLEVFVSRIRVEHVAILVKIVVSQTAIQIVKIKIDGLNRLL